MFGERSLAGVGLLFGTWAVAPNVREFGLVDPLAWAFTAAVWLAIVRQQWLGTAALAVVGVLAKEMVAITAVAAAAAAWEPRGSWWSAIRGALIVVPSVAVVVALMALVAGTHGGGMGVAEYISGWISRGLMNLGPTRVLYLVFASHAALWLLLPVGYLRLPPHLQRATLGLVGLGLALLAVGTPERMLAIVFPALITAGLAATRDWSLGWVWALAVGNTLFVLRVGTAALPAEIGWVGLSVATGVAVVVLCSWLRILLVWPRRSRVSF